MCVFCVVAENLPIHNQSKTAAEERFLVPIPIKPVRGLEVGRRGRTKGRGCSEKKKSFLEKDSCVVLEKNVN